MDKKSGESFPKFEVPVLEGQELAQEKAREKRVKIDTRDKSQKISKPNTSSLKDGGGGISSVIPVKIPLATDASNSKQNFGLTAADVDLIEKHWVDKAKSIVAQTLDDPHKQQSEINKEKVEYIKKRFNKTIPVDTSAKP